VSVVFTADAPVTIADATLHVGVLVAPLGPDVAVQVNATVPVNPQEGVTVTVDVLPVVAPATTVTAVPAMLNVELPDVVTVTVALPLDVT
jgi:hypothetical protein